MTGLSLSEGIRLARQQASLTQCQLAEQLGIRQAAVSSWETGRTAPTGDHLAALVTVFGPEVGRFIVDIVVLGAPRGREGTPQAQSSRAEGRQDAPGPARPAHSPPGRPDSARPAAG